MYCRQPALTNTIVACNFIKDLSTGTYGKYPSLRTKPAIQHSLINKPSEHFFNPKTVLARIFYGFLTLNFATRRRRGRPSALA